MHHLMFLCLIYPKASSKTSIFRPKVLNLFKENYSLFKNKPTDFLKKYKEIFAQKDTVIALAIINNEEILESSYAICYHVARVGESYTTAETR